MDSKYDVSIIIINYNGKRYIDNLFSSFQQMKKGDIRYEIIVVNNGSDDGSIRYLRNKYGSMQQLKIVEAGGNLGYAGGNNFGAEQATGRYLIFLNNDTSVGEDWLVNLYGFMKERPFCGMAKAKLVFFYDFISMKVKTSDKIILAPFIKINGREHKIDNKFCKNVLYESDRIVCFGNTEIAIPLLDGVRESELELCCLEECGQGNAIVCCGKEILLEGSQQPVISMNRSEIERNKYSLIQNAGSGINENYDGYDIGFCERDSEKYCSAYEVASGCGASIIMLKEDFEKCGKFDEKFFMYYEDADLSYRLRKLGKSIWFCPEAVVRHIHTGSSEEWSPFFCYQVSRNKLLFIRKNISFFKFVVYFLRQLRDAAKSKNKYQRWGCIDAVKIGVLGKKVSFFDH